MITIQTYLQRFRQLLRRLRVDPGVHTALRMCTCFLGGLVLSAASLGNYPQPLVLGLICASGGWPAVLMALGGSAGYFFFWGSAGAQGVVWAAAGLLVTLALADRPLTKTVPLLLPAAAALITAAVGLAFQVYRNDTTPVAIYLLRVVLSGVSVRVFTLALQRKDAIAQWVACGFFVLALAQIAPTPYLSLGVLATGALSTAGAFPAAALAGLALDLARISPVPMTAVACLTYFVRLVPRIPKWVTYAAPAAMYLIVMGLCDVWDLNALPCLVAGGIISQFLPGQQPVSHRRGETGVAQVRLEMAAGVLSQAQLLLLEAPETPIDEEALVLRAAERACGTCPCRKGCREREKATTLPPQLLHKPLLDNHDLPIACRKSGRFLQELHRTQEQLRAIRGDRQRQREYRSAVIQQYHFLSEYLQDLSDALGKRLPQGTVRYKPEVAFCANRPESDNADRCLHFAGVSCRYYVLLCDGMGTGLGAVQEGAAAAALLKKLLCAGFPAEYALRSLNSLCALRGTAGAATADLAELHLDTGRVLIYKWGAAPSYLISDAGAEKIGTASPPPGLSVTEARETVDRLSLRRGQTLILLSDGVGGEDALRSCFVAGDEPLGAFAARILENGIGESKDDATVAAVRLVPESLTQ